MNVVKCEQEAHAEQKLDVSVQCPSLFEGNQGLSYTCVVFLFDLEHRHEPAINYIDHVQRKDNDLVIWPAVLRSVLSLSLHHTAQYHLSFSLYLDI
jgi:hypothetical protein